MALKRIALRVGDLNAIVLGKVKGSMKRILVAVAMAAVGLGGVSLLAQDQNPGQNPGQDPNQPDGAYERGRAVARISILNGDVSVRRGDSGDVVAAGVNGPLMADDHLLTGSSARAEVELDFANVLRIGPNSEVRFSGMDISSYQMQVAAGTVTLRVLRPGQAQTELDTPSVALHPLQPGIYRVTVHEDGTSELTVRAGEAEIFGAGGSEHLQAGQTMNARGSGANTEFQVVQAGAPDSFDHWNEDRDRYLQRSVSYQHVSPDVTGAQDLDQNGRWTQDPTYGQVWQPNEPQGWAPYQNGQWVWEDYYGWTWVSYDPWGWAPYHYGRWFWGAGGWAWYPGPMYARSYWSPALVGFFGFGGGFGVGVGFGFGGVGWVPLAPFEVFHPWYGRGYYAGFRGGAFNGSTIVNNVNIANTYRNARITGAVTGVNTAGFGRGAQLTSLNRSQIQSAGLVRGAVPVAPDHSSLRMTNRAPSGNFTQSRTTSFASHMQAPRVDHVSFDQQQRSMQQLSRSNLSSAGAGNSFSRGTSAAGGGGWRSAGDRPGSAAGGSSRGYSGGSAAGSSQATHGWGRFGEPLEHGSGGAASPSMSGSARGYSSGGWRSFENTQPGSANNFARGGQAVHISPSIVQQRPSGSASSGSGRASGSKGRSSGGSHGGGGHDGGAAIAKR